MPFRTVYATLCLLVLGALAACAGQLPLIWDGGYQLAVSLINQEPYFYLTRFHSWFLWWPTVWLSNVTDNPSALVYAYGLPFLLAPAISIAASWWFVRKVSPGLLVWAILGVATSLPGQAFVINDSIFQQSLAWPVILGAMVPLSGAQRLLWLTLAAFQFSHQIGILILLFALAAAWFAGSCRRKSAATAILFACAILKTIWISNPHWAGRFFDSYAAQEASFSSAMWAFVTGVCGLPLAGLIILWIVAWCCLRADAGTRPLPRWWWKATLAALGCWVVWACAPNMWASAINYRRWVVPLAAPIVLMAILDARRRATDVAPWRQRLTLSVGVAFALVLSAQSLGWFVQLKRLQRDVASRPTPVVSATELPALKTYQLDHWGITSTLMVLQGPVPSHYLAYDPSSLAAISKEPFQVSLWAPHPIPAEPGPAGWFDHRPMVARLRELQTAPPTKAD